MIDLNVTPSPDEKGNIVGAVLVFRDISERRRTEEARSRLSAILESSGDAVMGISLEGTIMDWKCQCQASL